MPQKIKLETKLVDTNLIISFLTQDNPKLAAKAEAIFKKADKNQLELPAFILMEIVWVLISFYELDKVEVIEKLEAMLAFDKFKLKRKVLRKAIEFYKNEAISFVDAYLLAQGHVEGKPVMSFDKRVDGLS